MISNISTSASYHLTAGAAYAASSSDQAFTTQKSNSQKISDAGNSEKTNLSTRVTLSDEALKKLNLAKNEKETTSSRSNTEESALSDQEEKEVEDLQVRDREVRAHELAHVMAGGSLVRRGATYQYTTGPDGKRYAVGGEVSIDISPVEDDPSATITKMEQVKRAALAPAEPSSQDRSVAATAAQNEAEARQELLQQPSEEKNQ